MRWVWYSWNIQLQKLWEITFSSTKLRIKVSIFLYSDWICFLLLYFICTHTWVAKKWQTECHLVVKEDLYSLQNMDSAFLCSFKRHHLQCRNMTQDSKLQAQAFGGFWHSSRSDAQQQPYWKSTRGQIESRHVFPWCI